MSKLDFTNSVLDLSAAQGSDTGDLVVVRSAGKIAQAQGDGNWSSLPFGEVRTVSATGSTTLDGSEGVVICSYAGTQTIVLAAAAVVGKGKVVVIKKTGSAGAVTIDGSASETIDGAATYAAVDAQYDSLILMCDGTNWIKVAAQIA